ncbi:hypothetical protein [Eleftheria terrae]|uniref:hypothetical protein n=1 Tax=Eleftheria terrae TaxID=1597781 RepID=UPI00263B1301|nr:hypothetical protein [Eleftheria terrae]WKB50698.1 hypothetical protein N7L95_12770 [Eleftheria terrae]
MNDIAARSPSVRKLAAAGSLLLAACGLVLGAVGHPAHELRVLALGEGAAVREVLDTFRQHYPGLPHSSDARVLSQRAGPGVYLAVGPAALQAALEADLQPVVSLFASGQTYQQVLAAADPERRSAVTAIYAEASPQAQLEVIAALYQRRVTVGVLLSELTARLEPGLRRAASRLGLNLAVHRVAAGDNVVRELNALSSATVILALPDSSLYSKDNLGLLLESSYRRRQPIVGFSPALVHAGTLASAYASVEDIAAHLDEVLPQLEAGRLPEPQYPMYWRVAINEHVARSLSITVSDAVREMGNRPPGRPR